MDGSADIELTVCADLIVDSIDLRSGVYYVDLHNQDGPHHIEFPAAYARPSSLRCLRRSKREGAPFVTVGLGPDDTVRAMSFSVRREAVDGVVDALDAIKDDFIALKKAGICLFQERAARRYFK